MHPTWPAPRACGWEAPRSLRHLPSLLGHHPHLPHTRLVLGRRIGAGVLGAMEAGGVVQAVLRGAWAGMRGAGAEAGAGPGGGPEAQAC